jgi:hypothetical protein
MVVHKLPISHNPNTIISRRRLRLAGGPLLGSKPAFRLQIRVFSGREPSFDTPQARCRCGKRLAGVQCQNSILPASWRIQPSGPSLCTPRAEFSSLRQLAYKVLALQVELCVPRLIASCPEPRGRPSGLQAGSGRRARSPSLPPLSRLPRAFLPDPVRLGLLVEPEPLADVRHEAGHGATLCPSPETRLAIGSRSHGRNRRLASLQSLP